MNKQKFNNVVSNPDNISSDDKANLKSLAENYPYSQIIHSLVAKAYSSEKSPEYKKVIGTAAMYATDRQILKDLVTSVNVKVEGNTTVVTKNLKVSETESPSKETEETTKKKQVKVDIDTSSFYEDSEMLRNAIWSDLENLKLSKKHYLESLELSIESEKKLKKSSSKKTTKRASTTLETSDTEQKKVSPKKATSKKTIKAEAKKVVEKKAVTKSKTAKTKTSSAKPRAKKTTATKPKTESKSTKTTNSKSEKKTSTNDKEISDQRIEIKATLKEQINIIDSFIQKEPSISSKPVKTIESDQKDLSEKSTNFGDDLISENLAQILVEQGKSQKAIDMYKKLIWKFPQKKAYFAARIEDLTK